MSLLQGLHILDFTRLVPGPFATGILADLGADVLKLEDPGQGDYLRALSSDGAVFAYFNRGKRAVTLDLKNPRGQEVALRLAAKADVLVEGFRPGVMAALGLGWEAVRALNPRLVYCSISGYGQTGPLAKRAGHDLDFIALAGLLSTTGPAGGPPVVPGVPIADLAGGGLWAVIAILAALREADRSGAGQHLDVSMSAGAQALLGFHGASTLASGQTVQRGDSLLSGAHPAYGVYVCSDGLYLAVAALEDKFWARFCQAIGLQAPPDALRLPRARWAPLRASIETILQGRTRSAWLELLTPLDCCVEPVLDVLEAFQSPSAVVWDVPGEGGGSARQPGFPVAFSRTPAAPAGPPPGPGQHTQEVLLAAGYSGEDLAGLAAAGAFGPVSRRNPGT